MIEKVLVGESHPTGVDAYTYLAGIFFLNTLIPYATLFTNALNFSDYDCYDSCSLYYLIVWLPFYVPSLIIFGFPFLGMGLYSLFGRSMGFKGSLLKFMILYTTRYFGLIWHVVS